MDEEFCCDYRAIVEKRTSGITNPIPKQNTLQNQNGNPTEAFTFLDLVRGNSSAARKIAKRFRNEAELRLRSRDF